MNAWVLWHRYSDGSSASVHRVYLNHDRAKSDLELMETAGRLGCDGGWQLSEVKVFGLNQREPSAKSDVEIIKEIVVGP